MSGRAAVKPAPAPAPTAGLEIGISEIQPSTTNPRRELNGPALEELAASIATKGVLQPVLVRPLNGHYELVAGHRRFAAAKVAGLERIPAVIRELTDVEALEVQVIENLQRTDLHPLEEAQGYHQLMRAGSGYDATRIAERVGRSVKYVYDRIKLLALTKEAQKLFLTDKFSAGHAILLARLKPEDQKRALELSDRGVGGVFQEEHTLWDPQAEEQEEPVKPRSVRELQAWIDEHVRFDAKRDPDPMLFPETAATLAQAQKIIPITFDHYVQPEARAEGRTWGPRSWKFADGQEHLDPATDRKHVAKTCEHAVTGFVAVGAGRGEAFQVCVSKDKCETHWGGRRKKTKAAKPSKPQGPDRWEIENRKREAEKARWEKARPAVLKALAERILKASAHRGGTLCNLLISAVSPYGGATGAAKYVPLGSHPEDVVRCAAFIILWKQSRFTADSEFRRAAGALGINVQEIISQVAPPEKPAPAKKGRKK